ncbi:ankyrin repeat domain-containing protein 13C-B-like protein [Carex littledalei]|uniref:Ankyrin repeat domain-containing protein 13C-B-like protein n=1 Tax=Carex littledalei TaxID=544730 RepID=A0A833RLA1_9POAL|nr:ankyrin repeat domain-containing protein 13C-B-like protein [Carex littledalei]
MDDFSKYTHSPAHLAVARRDHAALRRIVAALPRLPKAGEVTTEAESIAGETTADAVSAVIDRRDVPNRETPLHLAVRMRDPVAADILMSAGADWSLQNAEGWSALQEAVCAREDAVASVIARHYQPLAWAKWCRRLPRILASITRIRDFYMEISFHFESSVIPFVSRIAPSDTYRIWKRGSSLRADMTLAGFDGFRIQRSDQTFLFLGDGATTPSGKQLPPGSLIVLSHKEKEITDALEGAGAQPTEAEVAHEVALMSKTNMYRPGIDVTQAELAPHLNWRRMERTEMVGNWKAKVHEMLHVLVTVKSRRVPGAMTDEELFNMENEERLGHVNGGAHLDAELDDVLTPEERKQLDSALQMGNQEGEYAEPENGVENNNTESSSGNSKDKKGWFGWHSGGKKTPGKHGSNSGNTKEDSPEKDKGKEKSSSGKKKKGGATPSESEYKKGVRPVLWLTPDFPLKTEELLPLLDVLANKVKAVRRLRELLTTKLPTGTFPVKIAIPIVPTIRVLITFTKFEELQTSTDEFATPPSSPTQFQDSSKSTKEQDGSSSWYSWVKGSRGGSSSDSDDRGLRDEPDPFIIPSDYTWVDANEKKRRLKAKRRSKRGSSGKKQPSSSRNSEGRQLMDGFE